MLLFDDMKCVERIASPLNYLGGKFRLLPQILPCFPEKINRFVDLFCGGCNVGINIDAEQVFLNDRNEPLIGLLKTFQCLKIDEILAGTDELIQMYGLSRSAEFGYEYYGCNGADGLASYNRDFYTRMRHDFNAMKVQNDEYFLRLYVLIVFAFNNQIRFNREGHFNLPVGKRDFNPLMRKKLVDFVRRLQEGVYSFQCADFREMDISRLTYEDFVYADPPYLITCATYNEQGGWSEIEECELFRFLDQLHGQGTRFALSNVLESKGRENSLLKDWISQNENIYRVCPLNFHYANSNYQTKVKVPSSCEILVVNY